MKQLPLILSIVSILGVIAMAIFSFPKHLAATDSQAETDSTSAVTAAKGDIVYIQLDKVVMEYDKYNDMRSTLESKAQGIQSDIERRGQKFQNDVNEFQNKINKGLMTRSVAEAQQISLSKQEQELNIYMSQKQSELQEEEFVMNNTIMNDIKTFLAEYNKTKGYSLILSTQDITNTILIGDTALDISDEVIKGLNESYIKSKNK